MLEDARIYRAYRGWGSPESSKHLMSVDAMRDKTLLGLEHLTFLDMLDVRGCEKLQSTSAYKQLVCQSSRQQQQQQHHPGQEYLSRTATTTQQVVDGTIEMDLNYSLLSGRGGNRAPSDITKKE